MLEEATALSMRSPRRGLAVDVFTLIRSQGLELAFLPLQRLHGAYVPPQAGTAGVLIHAGQPRGLQRYTAAHELAHHRLHGDQVALDDVGALFNESDDNTELEAQLFAGHLLMPPAFVAAAARQAGVRSMNELTPAQTYTMAGLLDVTYRAMAEQLVQLTNISEQHKRRLLRRRPSDLATSIGFGQHFSATTHVWPVTQERPSLAGTIGVGDELAVSLPENRTTGYRWFIRAISDATPWFDEYVTASSAPTTQPGAVIVGRGGRRHLIVRPESEGEWAVELDYAPPYRRHAPAATLTVAGVATAAPPVEWRKRQIDEFLANEQDRPA